MCDLNNIRFILGALADYFQSLNSVSRLLIFIHKNCTTKVKEPKIFYYLPGKPSGIEGFL